MQKTILDYIQENLLNNDDITLSADDDILGSGLVDSLGIMKIIQFIEKKFEVKVPPEDMIIENFISVNAMEIYLNGLKTS